MQTLQIIKENHVATVTLNRPEKRNAFNDEVIAELKQAFIELGQDDEVRAIVLTGTGKAFCAGADLNWMRAMADYTRDENLADANELAQMLKVIYECPKPTIASVQGDVYAGGVGLVSACDIAVAVDSANFCLSEVRLGLVPATISPYVIRAMGARQAHRYFLTAEVFNAEEAKRIGLIHDFVSAEVNAEINEDGIANRTELDETVATIVKKLVNASPNAVTVCKKLVQDVAHADITDELIADTVAGIADIRASEQGKEGVQSFLQKRKPNWLN